MIDVIIPARGGSRGIPRKNLQSINGKSLIQISVEQAHQIFHGYDHRVWVSSEDLDIQAEAQRHNARVINRPVELAQDESATIDVIKHALPYMDGQLLCLMQATNPFRLVQGIRACLPMFLKSGRECGFAAEQFHGFFWSHHRQPINRPWEFRLRRQDRAYHLIETGDFYIFNRRVADHPDWIWPDPYIFPGKAILEIDEPHDLELAQALWPAWTQYMSQRGGY